jgi:hypothetical protein
MFRSFRLVQIAAQAELLRLRRMASRTATRIALVLVALPFLLAMFGFFEASFWNYVSRHFIPELAALIAAGGNLLVAVIFLLIAAFLRNSNVEIEALKVRQRAIEDMSRQITLSALLVPVVRLVMDQMWRGREKRR